jgi:hypothetical protein
MAESLHQLEPRQTTAANCFTLLAVDCSHTGAILQEGTEAAAEALAPGRVLDQAAGVVFFADSVGERVGGFAGEAEPTRTVEGAVRDSGVGDTTASDV